MIQTTDAKGRPSMDNNLRPSLAIDIRANSNRYLMMIDLNWQRRDICRPFRFVESLPLGDCMQDAASRDQQGTYR